VATAPAAAGVRDLSDHLPAVGVCGLSKPDPPAGHGPPA